MANSKTVSHVPFLYSLEELDGDNFHLLIKTTRDISQARVINCAAASDETRMPVLGCVLCTVLGCTVYCVWVTHESQAGSWHQTPWGDSSDLVTRELHHGYHCPDVRPGAHPSSSHNSASRIVTHTWVTWGSGPCHTLVTIVWCVRDRVWHQWCSLSWGWWGSCVGVGWEWSQAPGPSY